VKSFEYAAPKTVKEATELLGQKWGEVEILAGGTDLISSLKQGITSPRRVVSLKNISKLRGIDSAKGSLQIGAMTPLRELIADKDVQKHFPALATAARNIGSPQMLNMGTVGGELCQRPRCWYFRNGYGLFGKDGDTSLAREGDNRYHSIFWTDGPALFVSASSLGPVLVALGATMTAEGPGGKQRQIEASKFFRVPASEQERETDLQPNEILTGISIRMEGLTNAIYEVRHRRGLDWPYVAAAVAFNNRNGRMLDSRVVLGHVAPTPWPSRAAAGALNGVKIDEATLTKAAEAAVSDAKPLSKNGYKVQLVKTAVKRAILNANGASTA
jgi:xanthine dehydrogenase YagS FAD-binding subunit